MSKLDLTKGNFNTQVLRAQNPVLVEFWAPWCTYCRRLAPAMEQLAQESQGRVAVGQVNIDDQPELAAQYGIDVIPTFLLFRDGAPGDKLVAPSSKAELDAFLTQS